MTVVVLFLVGLGLCIPFGIQRLRRRKILAQIESFSGDRHVVRDLVREFEAFVSSNRYVSNFEHSVWRAKADAFGQLANLDLSFATQSDTLAHDLKMLGQFLRNGREMLNAHNAEIMLVEQEELKPLLSKRGIPFNDEQLLAAVSEEDNTLVVAGAGTGKTTTILGKLSYLIDRLGVQPKDILVLSFTKKVVDELKERIDKRFGEQGFDIRTFHSFGLSVLGEVLSEKPSIFDLDERGPWIQGEFNNFLKEDAAYMHAAVHYFAYHMQYEDTDKRFKTMDEYYQYIKTEGVVTFKKEKVKSYQEAMIANFLFLNGVNYEYETAYKFATADKEYRQYQPDFYLPDHDIYLEHFGIDRKGNVRFTDNESQNVSAGIKYREGMEWKRNLHKQKETKLIETFSYQFSEQNWEALLTRELSRHGVDLVKRPLPEVIATLQESGQIMEIVKLFATFLDLTKSNHFSESALREIIERRDRPRDTAFGTLFLPLYRKYEEYLALSKKIDFHDMLNMASTFIEHGRFLGTHRYIIIDEFQDFSVSKDLMVRALCKQDPSVKLFCVGDDWQSIYRFAGADVSLMTHFEKYHGYTNNLRLVRTNRFDKKLATITNEFILKNPSQIKKEIVAAKELEDEPLSIVKAQFAADAPRVVGDLLEEINKEAGETRLSVYLLGRYGFNKPDDLNGWKRDFSNLDISFVTAHSSKGLEADRVIVLDVVSGKYGFPSQIADDPVLNIVMQNDELSPHAEERRLMYVALTRTRSKVYVVSRSGSESIFVRELEDQLDIREPGTVASKCPSCGGEIVERTGKFGAFYGCRNYPRCPWTQNKGIRPNRTQRSEYRRRYSRY